MSYSSPHLREIVHYNLDQDFNNNSPLTFSKAKNQISYHQLILLNQFSLIDLSQDLSNDMNWFWILQAYINLN
jgi:hypothetical protein